jgi:ATP-binding cassette subfamily C protein
VDVLLGLLRPTSGDVTSGGVSIFDHLRYWQKRIGYIPQQIYLGDFSIRENVAWGIPKEKIDPVRLEEAVKAAQLHEFVAGLPDKLETIVGERGVRLSGGQRQRIGIARALYHRPDILVMDEATSALDNETEKYVIEAIEHLKGKRTIIMIAHRLSTVKNCDVIYEMKDGQIARAGVYHDLYKD